MVLQFVQTFRKSLSLPALSIQELKDADAASSVPYAVLTVCLVLTSAELLRAVCGTDLSAIVCQAWSRSTCSHRCTCRCSGPSCATARPPMRYATPYGHSVGWDGCCATSGTDRTRSVARVSNAWY
eukprot:3646534-Rhodomonas_salina.6